MKLTHFFRKHMNSCHSQLSGLWRDAGLPRRLIEAASLGLRQLPPEMAHNLSLKALQNKNIYRFLPGSPRSLRDLRVRGPYYSQPASDISPGRTPLYLPHPVGLAAGYDKNAACIEGLERLGFSMIEVGTITPRPQSGHPLPRLFRLSQRRELINKMGFPNEGMEQARRHLSALPPLRCCVGINIGKNLATESDKALEDYLSALSTLRDFGDYFVINVSSPNTPGLRDLARDEFFHLASQRLAALEPGLPRKVWIKLDPDGDRTAFQSQIQSVVNHGFGGVILCNTHSVERPHRGGLSGHSLRTMAQQRLIWAREVHQGNLAMISVGGISTGCDVFEALKLGACGVQIYTAMVYRGPWAVHKIIRELSDEMTLRGINSLSQLGNHLQIP